MSTNDDANESNSTDTAQLSDQPIPDGTSGLPVDDGHSETPKPEAPNPGGDGEQTGDASANGEPAATVEPNFELFKHQTPDGRDWQVWQKNAGGDSFKYASCVSDELLDNIKFVNDATQDEINAELDKAFPFIDPNIQENPEVRLNRGIEGEDALEAEPIPEETVAKPVIEEIMLNAAMVRSNQDFIAQRVANEGLLLFHDAYANPETYSLRRREGTVVDGPIREYVGALNLKDLWAETWETTTEAAE